MVSSLALFCRPRRVRLPQGRFVTALRLLLITLPVALFATVHFQPSEVFPQGFAHQCRTVSLHSLRGPIRGLQKAFTETI